MLKRLDSPLGLLCVLVLLGLLTRWALVPLAAEFPGAVVLPADADFSGWLPLLDVGSNALHPWRFNPLLLAALPASAPIASAYGLLCAALLAVGMSLLLYCSAGTERSPLLAAVGGVCSTAALLWLYGNQLVVLSAASCLPWLILAAVYFLRFSSGSAALAVLAVLAHTWLTANQLSLFVSLAALAAAHCMSPKKTQGTRGALLICMFALPLLAHFFAHPVVFPSYPPLARVVPGNGLSGMIRPLIGPGLPLPVIDRVGLKENYRPLLLLTAALCAWALLGGSSSWRKSALYPAVLLLGLSTADVLLPESISHVLPVSAVRRILPGLFYVSLLPLTAACGLLLLAASAWQLFQYRTLLPLALLLLLPCGSGSPAAAHLLRGRDHALREYSQQPQTAAAQLVLHSPSYSLINQLGLWIVHNQALLRDSRFIDLDGFDAALTASHNSEAEKLQLMQDRRRGTRWTSGRGRQDGSEWVHIRFDRPQRLQGIELNPGQFHSDFPRGVLIAALESCVSRQNLGAYRQLLSVPHWQGSVKFTKSGHPYYSDYSEVKLYFPAPATVQCLLISQTGTAPVDWSISRLRLLTAADG